MKIVCISDTHTKHQEVILPKGDLLIHAGDVSWVGWNYSSSTFSNGSLSRTLNTRFLLQGIMI